MLSQDDYVLYTGVSANLSDENWQKIVGLSASRLAGMLCLDKLPATEGGPLTAEEYDHLKLTSAGYDSKNLTAREYDTVASILLGVTQLTLPLDLAMLLANFICMMLAHRGIDSQITSKKVRNFTINYGSNAATAFAKLVENYGDIVAKYSACGTGFRCEKSTRCLDGCF